MRRSGLIAPLALALAVWSQPYIAPGQAGLLAQSLEEVEALAKDGRGREARTLLTTWWEWERAGASRSDRQLGLWLRAILELDPTRAALDYRRLAIEYPGGTYSGRALARLANIHMALGETKRAADAYETLARDYPRSEEAELANRWLAENRAVIARARSRDVASPERPASAPDEPVENAADGRGDRATVSAIHPEREAQALDGDFTVQLGAFSDDARARTLLEVLSEAGFEPRLVTLADDELFRVRVGRFESPMEATRVYDRLVAGGFEAMVVADAAREEGR